MMNTERNKALEEAAQLIDSMHNRIGEPLIVGEDRADAAHNTLTNCAKEVRAMQSAPAAANAGGQARIDTQKFRELTFAYAKALMHGSVPESSQAWAVLVEHVDSRPTATSAAATPQDEREAYNGEEWELLAMALAAEEHDDIHAMIYEGGPIPEPWGEVWQRYEDDAKRMIALVRKHAAAALSHQAAHQERDAVDADRYFPFEFEVWQGEIMCASASGPRDIALREAQHYAAQYEQDGPVRIFEVRRVLVDAAMQAQGERG